MTTKKLTVGSVASALGLDYKSVHERHLRGESLEEILSRGRVAPKDIRRPLKYSYQGRPISSAEVALLAGIARITAKKRLAAGESAESIIATGKKTTNKYTTGTKEKPSVPFVQLKTGLSKYIVDCLLASHYTHEEIISSIGAGMKIYHQRGGVYELFHPSQLTVAMVAERTKIHPIKIELRVRRGETLHDILVSRRNMK